MNLRQLRYFLHVADTGSFSKASELLRVAQSSLSQHVRALEDELGTPLLSRHPRGVTLTDSGNLLCEHARRILRDVEQSRHALQTASANPSGEVLLGLPSSACRGLFKAVVSEAERLHPHVSLHVVEAMTGSIDEWVNEGRLDVAVLYASSPRENVERFPLLTEELKLIVRPGHPLAGERAVWFRDVATYPLALPSQPNAVRRLLEQNAARSEVELKVAVNCDSLYGIIELVRAGYVTLYPSFAMVDEIRSGDLRALPVVNPAPKWRVSVAMSHKTTNPRASAAIADLVLNVGRRLVETGNWDAQLR